MKIAVIGTRGFPGVQGGVEQHCEKLYPRLVKLGCEVTVFTRSRYVDRNRDYFEGVKLIALDCPRSKNFEAIIHTFKGILEAKKLKPDVIHLHAIGPALLVPLAKILGMSVVMTHHGPDYKRGKWGIVGKAALRLGEVSGVVSSDAVICIARNIADDVARRFGRKTSYIPNGIDIPEIVRTDEILKKFALDKNRYILSVGRLVPEKGLGDLIKAFGAAQPAGWKLVIAGAADHEDRYSKSIASMAKNTENVVLAGFLTGRPLAELYSNAAFFVLPSYYEGLPIALLEAMSYALPCIASDIPANKALELPRSCYYKAGDVKALSEKISGFVKMGKNPEEASAILIRLKSLYNWDTIASKTLSIYKEVAELRWR